MTKTAGREKKKELKNLEVPKVFAKKERVISEI